MNNPYLQYYQRQAQSGIGNVYVGSPYQSGHGIGSFLGGLFRYVMPIVKQGAKTVGKELLKSGVNMVNDVVMDQQPLKEAFHNRMDEAKTNLTEKAKNKLKTMVGSGYKVKKRKMMSHSLVSAAPVKTRKRKRASRRKIHDIFD